MLKNIKESFVPRLCCLRYKPRMKHACNLLSTMSAITSEESSLSSDEEDSNQQTKAVCGECGKELDNKWKCTACRIECPICNRALTKNPEEFCERCFKKCQLHGLYSKSANSYQCPQCVKQ